MNQSELTSYLILLGIKQLVTRVFSYHETEKKLIYVNRDKLIVKTCILDVDTALISNNTITTEYHYPVTIEQLKETIERQQALRRYL